MGQINFARATPRANVAMYAKKDERNLIEITFGAASTDCRWGWNFPIFIQSHHLPSTRTLRDDA